MAKVRQWWYLIAGAIAALIPILVQLGLIGSDTAQSSGFVIESIGSLLGGGAALTAGAILSKQRKSGTVDQSPIDLVVTNIPVVYEQAVRAEANVRKMQSVANDVFGGLSTTPFAQTASNAANAVESLAGQVMKDISQY